MAGSLEKRGRWLPWVIIGFFAVIFVVNGVFMFFAIETHPGVDTQEAYEKGRHYNETLEKAAEGHQLGWQFSLGFSSPGKGETDFVLTVLDAEGHAVDGLDLTALIVRPVEEGFDQRTKLAGVGQGQYQARVLLPLKGLWEVRVLARDDQDDSAQFIRRVVIK